jgi:hypothetical protein
LQLLQQDVREFLPVFREDNNNYLFRLSENLPGIFLQKKPDNG